MSQAEAVDIQTKVPVGRIPHFDEVVRFLRDPGTQPKDRATLIHGDYKIDNLVYHKTKPRVIGILEYVTEDFLVIRATEHWLMPHISWEMSTIGHSLSDLSNLLGPYSFAVDPPNDTMSARTNPAFLPSAHTAGLPLRSRCVEWYKEIAGWDPAPELEWGDAFAAFRNSVIMQGIAARYALRQASSAQAKEIGGLMGPYGEFSWGLIARWWGEAQQRSRL